MRHAGFAILFAIFLAPHAAKADGGVVRTRETKGPFVITLFTPPDVSTAVPADVTVMVQRRATGEVVMDAAVNLGFVPPAGANIRTNTGSCCCTTNNAAVMGTADATGKFPSVLATRAQTANKLLYGANVLLPVIGVWQVRATIRQGSDEAVINCALPVAAPPRRFASLWPFLAIAPVAILLFALNQWLRTGPPGLCKSTRLVPQAPSRSLPQ